MYVGGGGGGVGTRLAVEVNRHFLENEYGDISFFCCCCFEMRNKFLYVI